MENTMSQEIQMPCPSCGKEGVSSLGQSLISRRLRWYRSTSCTKCGNIEEDGEGFPPPEYHKQLLEAGGRWKLIVDLRFKAPFLKVLKSLLGLLLLKAKAIKFPEVFVGTKTEVEWLAFYSEAGGVAVEVQMS